MDVTALDRVYALTGGEVSVVVRDTIFNSVTAGYNMALRARTQ